MSQLGQIIRLTGTLTGLAGDIGSATPALGSITIAGGNNIGTIGAGNTITVNLDGTTNHAVQVGNVGGSLSSLAVGGTGVILQGNTGADPSWSTATYPSTVAIGDVLVASAANVIGVVAGATTAGHILTANGAGSAPTFQAPPAGVTYASDAETLAGTVTNKAVAPSNLKAKLGLQTVHALPVGNSDSLALDWLAVGGDGTVLIGNTGADPSFSANPTVTTIYATTFDTNVVAAGTTLSGTTWAADGTDANIGLTITPKGTGDVTVTLGDVILSGGNLALPNSTALVGQIQIDGGRFFHNGGSETNFFAGKDSGGFASAGSNVGIGWHALINTSGSNNIACGLQAMDAGVSGSNNCGYGYDVLSYCSSGSGNSIYGSGGSCRTKTGSYNEMLGYGNGTAYTGAESYNIIIGSNITGTLGESNKLRIGNGTGSGANQIDKAYISGIYNTAVGATAGVVLADSSNQLGGLAGLAGQILQGGTKPAFSTATYPSTVAIGDVLIASADNTIGVVTGATTAGHVLMANGAGSAPSFQALPASGIVNLVGDDAGTATGTNVTVAGGTNIGTTGAGSTLTVNLDSTITLTGVNATTFDTNVVAAGTTLSGTTWAADGTDANIGMTITPKGTGDLTVSVGDVAISAGNLNLPTTSSTVGQIVVNGSTWAHSYGTNSIYLGFSAGNFTHTGGGRNIGIGLEALNDTISATDNVAIGYYAAPSLTNWSQCVVIGAEAGKALSYNIGSATGNGSVVIGYKALNTVYGNGNCSDMVVIGREACKYLQQNQQGSVVIGANALKNGGAGSLSTIIGTNVLTTYTGTGGANTIIGAYACNSTNGANTFNLNTILGYTAGRNLSVASNAITDNTFIGSSSANAMTSGSNLYNVFLGGNTGATITTGNIQNNTFLGYAAGNSYPAASVPQYCINIGSGCSGTGTETYVTRIGQTTGANAQTSCFIGGIYNITPGGTLNVALVDSNGQLGSVANLGVAQGGTGAGTLTDHGILLGSGTSAITATAAPTDGQLLIGSTGNDPSLATLTAGTNVTVTNGAGSIALSKTIETINNQTDSYQLVAGDAGKFITMTKGTANTLTVPKDATINFAVGTYVYVYQGGAGVTTIAPEDGTIVINSVAGNLDISAQYGVAKLVKIAANTWVAFGDLA
jgi:hypothetical protein